MLVSLKEISKYVNISSLDVEDIAKKLTFAGIEVEEITKFATGTNLVIGQVITCQKIEGSDHLSICKVNIGKESLDIVCGAPNVRAGLKVIVAKVGAKLKDIEIKATTIKGHTSNGMLCSLLELGVDRKYLSEEQINGIEELPSSSKVGETDVLGYLGLDDTVLNLSLLANRSDCYALFNVAREIAALFNLKVKLPICRENQTYLEKKFKVGSTSNNCKQFYGKIVKGIKIEESPKWLKEILNASGIRSRNNVVDLGNYIMLLTGRPLHIYDFDNLKNDLIVKDDIEQKLVGLDGKKYQIKKGDLTVTTNKGIPVCLGGILGGENSEITEKTKNILIEVASFNSTQIRKTSTRLGLSSDSSQRFIKGIDQSTKTAIYTMNLTTNILKKYIKFSDISNLLKYDVIKDKEQVIKVSKDYINNKLGTDFNAMTIKNVLTKLYFKVTSVGGGAFVIKVPSFRIDIAGKADIAEEVIRYLGLENIKSILPTTDTTVGKLHKYGRQKRWLENFLISKGVSEALTYTLIDKNSLDLCKIFTKDDVYVICNPLTEEHKYVRSAITPSLIDVTVYNYNHEQKDVAFFEISKVTSKTKLEEHLSVVLLGNKYQQDKYGFVKFSYFDAKGIVESILDQFNIQESRIKLKALEENKLFHPYKSAEILLDNKPLAKFGEIHPLKLKEYGIIKENMVALELNLTLLFETKSKNNKYETIPIYPSSTRDYAIIVDKAFEYGKLKTELKKLSSLIKEINVFDVFEKLNVEDGLKSVAFTVTFQSLDHTLKENEIVEVDLKIKDYLENKIKVTLRK